MNKCCLLKLGCCDARIFFGKISSTTGVHISSIYHLTHHKVLYYCYIILFYGPRTILKCYWFGKREMKVVWKKFHKFFRIPATCYLRVVVSDWLGWFFYTSGMSRLCKGLVQHCTNAWLATYNRRRPTPILGILQFKDWSVFMLGEKDYEAWVERK